MVYFAGKNFGRPQVAGNVDDSAMTPQNRDVGKILCIIGECTGGQPNKALYATSYLSAKNQIKSGDLLTACEQAFSPSGSENGAYQIIMVRVNPAIQSTLTLKKSVTDKIVLTSKDYGIANNRIRVKLETGTNWGKKSTLSQDGVVITKDDIGDECFTVTYTGSATTCTMDVTATKLTTTSSTGTESLDLTYAAYPTVSALVTAINTNVLYTAVITTGKTGRATTELDLAASLNIKTGAQKVTAHFHELLDYYNSSEQGFVTAALASAATNDLPDNLAYTFMTGGTEGTTTNTHWQNAYNTLRANECTYICPIMPAGTTIDNQKTIITTGITHCSDMRATKPRSIVSGLMVSDVTDVDVNKGYAAYFGSDLCTIVIENFTDNDNLGNLVTRTANFYGAKIAGLMAGQPLGSSITYKYVRMTSLVTELTDEQKDFYYANGITVTERLTGRNAGFRIVGERTTWLADERLTRTQPASVTALQELVYRGTAILDDFIGKKETLTIVAEARAKFDTMLRLAQKEDEIITSYTAPSVTVTDDVITVEFEASPIINNNYGFVNVRAVREKGLISA